MRSGSQSPALSSASSDCTSAFFPGGVPERLSNPPRTIWDAVLADPELRAAFPYLPGSGAPVEDMPVKTLRAILKNIKHSADPENPEQIIRQLEEKAELYRRLMDRLHTASGDDPEVIFLRGNAKTAVEEGRFRDAERCFIRIADRALAAATDMEAQGRRVRSAAAASRADSAEAARLETTAEGNRRAAAHYAEAARIVAVTDETAAMEYRLKQAQALCDLGNIWGENDALRQAVDILENLLRQVRRKEQPERWAKLQNRRGNILRILGQYASSPDFLAQAVTAYKAALKIFTRARFPYERGATLNNLGNAFHALGARTSGDQGMRYLKKAACSHRAALKILTRGQVPSKWEGIIRNNIGNTFHALGERAAQDTQYPARAVAAYKAALKIFTRTRFPCEWGATLNNLGNAFHTLGARTSGDQGIRYLKKAEGSCKGALKVRTRERLPLQWAMTQSNLGSILQSLGERSPGSQGAEYFKKAVGAFQAALEVRARERLPLQWALTQGNLGTVFAALGERDPGPQGTRRLRQAVDIFQAALEAMADGTAPAYRQNIEANLDRARRLLDGRAPRPGARERYSTRPPRPTR